MTIDYQNSFGDSKNLEYAYYLTNNYDVKFLIPIEEDHFYVFLRFEDDVVSKDVRNLKKYDETKLLDLETDTLPTVLQEEIYRFISARFDVENPKQLNAEINDYVLNMTIKELATQDWRFPMNIAMRLQLAPKQLNRNTYDYRQGHYMLCEVIMENDNNLWKVKKFETVAISRWK